MSAPHILPTLLGVELPGYMAMGKRAAAMVAELEPLFTTPYAKVVEQLRPRIEGEVAIAEGLFANFELAEHEDVARQFPNQPWTSPEAAASPLVVPTPPARQTSPSPPPAGIPAPQPVANAAPTGRAANGGIVGVWTPARMGLLRKEWPDRTLTPLDILKHVNALPGHPCLSVGGIQAKALALGLRRRSRGDAEAQIAADADPAADGVFSSEDLHEARAMLAKGGNGRELHAHFGGTLDQWAAFASAYRRADAA